MKKINAFILALAIITAVPIYSVFAGGGGSTSVAPIGAKGDIGPKVPISIVVQGRQAVTEYLKARIDYTTITFSGNSVVEPAWRVGMYFDRVALRVMGYIHDGSFAEYSDAVFGVAFSGDVVATPDGYYDVRVFENLYDADGALALTGNGYLNINDDGHGNLQVGQFEPYVSINGLITVVVPGRIDAAKWVGKHGVSIDLSTSWDSRDGKDNTTIQLSSGNIENGFLLLAGPDNHITGYDLTSSTTISGKHVYALLGQTHSGDVQVVRYPASIDAGYNGFSLYGDMILGSFPVLEYVTPTAVAINIKIAVPVWGDASQQTVGPSRIWVKPIYMDGPSSTLTVGVETELVPQVMLPGTTIKTFRFEGPAGGYNIRTEYEGLHSWEEVFGGGKGY